MSAVLGMRVLYVSVMDELEMKVWALMGSTDVYMCNAEQNVLVHGVGGTVECFCDLQCFVLCFPVLSVFPCPSPSLQPIAGAYKNSATEDRRI